MHSNMVDTFHLRPSAAQIVIILSNYHAYTQVSLIDRLPRPMHLVSSISFQSDTPSIIGRRVVGNPIL